MTSKGAALSLPDVGTGCPGTGSRHLAGCWEVQHSQTGLSHSLPSLVIAELFSAGRISAPTLLWGATHVTPQSALSTILKMRVCGRGRGGGGGEFWSPGEIKLSFSVDIRVVRLSINSPIWKWMYYVLTLFLVFLVEEKGG